jgi:multisubunit Na+/H+ antiporter MnhC subunit
MGLLCFFIRPSTFRQIAGLKLLLQSVSLGLVLAGWERQDLQLVQSMIVSTLVVEAIVIGLALTMIIRINKQQQLAEIEDMGPPGEEGEAGDG